MRYSLLDELAVDRRTDRQSTWHHSPAVDARPKRVDAQNHLQDQLCVPLMTLKGASYRLRNRGIDTLPSIRAAIDQPDN